MSMDLELESLAKVLARHIAKADPGARAMLLSAAEALGECPSPDEVRALIKQFGGAKYLRAEEKRAKRASKKAEIQQLLAAKAVHEGAL